MYRKPDLTPIFPGKPVNMRLEEFIQRYDCWEETQSDLFDRFLTHAIFALHETQDKVENLPKDIKLLFPKLTRAALVKNYVKTMALHDVYDVDFATKGLIAELLEFDLDRCIENDLGEEVTIKLKLFDEVNVTKDGKSMRFVFTKEAARYFLDKTVFDYFINVSRKKISPK